MKEAGKLFAEAQHSGFRHYFDGIPEDENHIKLSEPKQILYDGKQHIGLEIELGNCGYNNASTFHKKVLALAEGKNIVVKPLSYERDSGPFRFNLLFGVHSQENRKRLAEFLAARNAWLVGLLTKEVVERGKTITKLMGQNP